MTRKRVRQSKRSTRSTRRNTQSTRRNTRSTRSKRRNTRARQSKRSRGGAMGAPLAQAFSGVVLPSDVYRPILKPMHGGAHGGDGYAYQAHANLAVPNAPLMKGRRRRGKRSIKRRGKHAPGHALPPGFGQMPSSFRPL